MKAQGLPINFIVLAALAILILILAAGFVIGGGASAGAALSPATVKNTCNNGCLNLQNQASTVATKASWTLPATSAYCNTYTITGQTTKLQCSAAAIGASCTVSFQDGTNCVIGCAAAPSTAVTCT